MQIFLTQLDKDGRPPACQQCTRRPECAGPHKHGGYFRWRGTEGQSSQFVQRYICPMSRRTWSVIPEGMMPFRCMEAQRLQELVDKRLESAGGDARPPPASEKEQGCIRRALKRLSERIPFLCGLLGQQMPLLGRGDIRGFWSALRKLGSTEDILVRLARDFKTSLFGCYRSLQAFSQREKAPAGVA